MPKPWATGAAGRLKHCAACAAGSLTPTRRASAAAARRWMTSARSQRTTASIPPPSSAACTAPSSATCPTSVRRADTLADQGAAGAGVPIDRHEVPSILGGRLLHSRRSWSKLVLWAAAGAVGAVPMPFHIGLGAIETSLCPPNGWISFGFVVGSSARHALHRAVADARDGPTRVYASPRTALARPRASRAHVNLGRGTCYEKCRAINHKH